MIIIFLESSRIILDDLNAHPRTIVIYRVLGIRNNLKGTWKSFQWKVQILPLIPSKENGSSVPQDWVGAPQTQRRNSGQSVYYLMGGDNELTHDLKQI